MKKHFYYTISLFMALCLLFGCSKENNDTPDGKAFQVTSLFPNSGKAQTLVTIVGTGFQKDYTANKVSFNGTETKVISATDTSLVVLAPTKGSTGVVSVTSGDKTVEAGEFTYQNLSISSVSPLRVSAYETMTIKGYGFKGGSTMPEVKIGSSSVKIISVSDSVMLLSVPENGMGKGALQILADGKSVSGPEVSIVKVLDYLPKAGFGGAELTITGAGFNPTKTGNKVFYRTSEQVWEWIDDETRVRVTKYYTDTLQIISAAEDKLVARMPEEVKLAEGTIEIQSDGIKQLLKSTETPTFNFLYPPAIRRVSPEEPKAGTKDYMSIYGTDLLTMLDGMTTRVFIGQRELLPEEISGIYDSRIDIDFVPADLPDGVVKVIANGITVEGPFIKFQR